MRVSDLLNQIERRIRNPITRKSPVDRFELLSRLEEQINELAEQIQYSSLVKRIHPLVNTVVGVRSYALPDDFPENFTYGDDDVETQDDSRYACFLDLGSSEQNLKFQSPARFFAEHPDHEANGIPEDYTIITSDSGNKELWIGPPPDSNSSSNYTIAGVYQPTYWNIQEMDDLVGPSISLNAVKYGVISQFDPNYQGQYQMFLRQAYLKAAQSKVTRIQPGWRSPWQ